MKSGDAIVNFLQDTTCSAYQADLETRSAVERQFQNLPEAAFRLGADAEKLCPEIDWRAVRGHGNVLRHEYDEIQDEIIWQARHDRLPQLRLAVQAALATLTNSGLDAP